MLRTALISLDHFAAQGSLLDCLADVREKGIARVSPTHVVKLGHGQVASCVNKDALENGLRDHVAGLLRVFGAAPASSIPRTCGSVRGDADIQNRRQP